MSQYQLSSPYEKISARVLGEGLKSQLPDTRFGSMSPGRQNLGFTAFSPRLNSSQSPPPLLQNRFLGAYQPVLSGQISLHSENERVSQLNIYLKQENEALRAEISRLKTATIGIHARIPDLESQLVMVSSNVRNLEEALRAKDRQIEEKDRRINDLRRQMEDYALIDRSNVELLTNNRSLLAEVDKLYALLRNKTEEFDNVKSDNERLLALPSLVQELTKRIELLDLEVGEKDKGIQKERAKLDELWLRLEEFNRQNDKQAREIESYEQESHVWKVRMEEEEKRHQDVVDGLRRELVLRQKIAGEEARSELLESFRGERENLETRLDDTSRKLKDYEGKILALTHEIERLNEGLADKMEQLSDKINENDELKRELFSLQKQFATVRNEDEADRQIEFENARRELISTFSKEKAALEEEIRRLRIELGEIERLKRAVEIKEGEVKDLNRIIRDLEEKGQKRIDELNQLWEGKTKLAIEREIRELGSRFINEREELEQQLRNAKSANQKLEGKTDLQNEEIKRLSNLNDTKSQENLNLKEEIMRKDLAHQKEISDLKRTHLEELRKELGNTGDRIQQEANKEIERLQKKNESLEAKVLALADELSQLANTNEEQFAELEQSRLRIRGMEQRHDTELKELRATAELEARLKGERELAELRAGSDRDINTLEGKWRAAEQAKRTLEAKAEFLEQDRSKISEENNSLHKQVLDLKHKQRELELSKNSELDALKKQLEGSKQASIERDQYRGKLDNVLQDLSYYKEKASEVDLEKSREIQNLKKELGEIENRSYKQKRELEDQLEGERKNSLDTRELQIRFGSEKAGYENKIRQLKTINENGKQEMEKLYDLLNQRKKEHEAYLKQNEDLRKQVEKLQKQLKAVEESGDPNADRTRRQREDDLIDKVEELEKEKKYFREQSERYASQLEHKKEELQERVQEIENLKHVYEVSLQKMGVDFMDKLNAGEK